MYALIAVRSAYLTSTKRAVGGFEKDVEISLPMKVTTACYYG